MHHLSTRQVNWLLLSSYILLLSVLLWRHEMWRDELHTWALVTNAHSLSELLYAKRYEGHPTLWYVLLWSFSRLSNQPILLQCVHGLLAIATASLVIFRSPFKFWEKALLVWGYFLLYEYGVISRNYQVGILIAFGLITSWPLALRNPILMGVGLALLFQVSAFSIILGISIGATFLLEQFQTRRLISVQMLVAVALAFLGLLGAYLTMRTPPDLTYRVAFQWHWNWGQVQTALATIYQGLVPLSTFGSVDFWNTNIVSDQVYQAGLSVICLSAVVWSLSRSRVSMVLFGVTALLIFFFAYISYAGSVRHNGHYMIALICSYWLYRCSGQPYSRRPAPVFTMLLLIQFVAGLHAAYMDGRYAFSMARPLVRYLKQNYPPDVLVAGSYNNLMTPIASYLGRNVYTLSTHQYGSYVLWNKASWNEASLTMPDSALFAQYLVLHQRHPNSVLVMAYHPFSHPDVREGSVYTLRTAGKSYQFQCVTAFQPAIVPDENYYIFQLKSATTQIH